MKKAVILLSGGLDSSLVAACAAKFARKRIEEDDKGEAWWPRLHSFAVGLVAQNTSAELRQYANFGPAVASGLSSSSAQAAAGLTQLNAGISQLNGGIAQYVRALPKLKQALLNYRPH